MYTEILRADLQTHAGPVQDRLIVQDPQGSAYFDLRLGYPRPGETISGIITAERIANAHLTTTRPIITNVCFQRPSQFPNGQSAKFDFFDCQEGKACRPSQRATGWLNPCNPPHAEHRGWLEPLLGGVVRAEARDQADAASAEIPFWSVPSLTALTQRGVEGVGYTVFTIQTDAFRQSEITGVEVDLRVDGIAINEDSLPPELRPVANDPRNPFVSRFALQTLDFEGAQGGCDRIELALRPVMSSGSQRQAPYLKPGLCRLARCRATCTAARRCDNAVECRLHHAATRVAQSRRGGLLLLHSGQSRQHAAHVAADRGG